MANHNALLTEDNGSLLLQKQIEGSIPQKIKDFISPHPTHDEDWMSLTWSKERSAVSLTSWPAERTINIPFSSISRVVVLLQEPRLFASLFTVWLLYLDGDTPRILRLLIRIKQVQNPIELVFRIARIMQRPSYIELWKSNQFLHLSLETASAPTDIDYRRAASSLIAIPSAPNELIPCAPPSVPSLGRVGEIHTEEWRPGEQISLSLQKKITSGMLIEHYLFDLQECTLLRRDTRRYKDSSNEDGPWSYDLSAISTFYLQRDGSSDTKGSTHRALIILDRHKELLVSAYKSSTPKLAQAFNDVYPTLTKLSDALCMPWITNLSATYHQPAIGYALPDGTAVFLHGAQFIARSPSQSITQIPLPSSVESYDKALPQLLADGVFLFTLRYNQGQPYSALVSWRSDQGLREIWRSKHAMHAVRNQQGTLLIHQKESLLRKHAEQESPTPLPSFKEPKQVSRMNAHGDHFYITMRDGRLLRSTDEGDTWLLLRDLPVYKEGHSTTPARAFCIGDALWFISPQEALCMSGPTIKAPRKIHFLGVVSHQGRTVIIARENTLPEPNETLAKDESSLVLFVVEGDALVRLPPVALYEVGARPTSMSEHSPHRIDALYLQEPYRAMRLSGFQLYSAFSQPDGIYLTGKNGVDQFAYHHSGGSILCIPQWELASFTK